MKKRPYTMFHALVVQWTENQPSNLLVVGSNLNKSAPIFQ